eukprot:1318039-Amorphochlora_amoeboformis.AAC.2
MDGVVVKRMGVLAKTCVVKRWRQGERRCVCVVERWRRGKGAKGGVCCKEVAKVGVGVWVVKRWPRGWGGGAWPVGVGVAVDVWYKGMQHILYFAKRMTEGEWVCGAKRWLSGA